MLSASSVPGTNCWVAERAALSLSFQAFAYGILRLFLPPEVLFLTLTPDASFTLSVLFRSSLRHHFWLGALTDPLNQVTCSRSSLFIRQCHPLLVFSPRGQEVHWIFCYSPSAWHADPNKCAACILTISYYLKIIYFGCTQFLLLQRLFSSCA